MDEIVGWLLFQVGASVEAGRGAPERPAASSVGEEVELLPALELGLGAVVSGILGVGFSGGTNHGAI